MSSPHAHLEMSVDTARELVVLGAAILLDVRQPFELDIEGRIPAAIHVPLFHFKHRLGHKLSASEQELLDADEPGEKDVALFLAELNAIHFEQDLLMLCLCNSGRRSLVSADVLRSLGYRRSFSIQGGWRAWSEADIQPDASAAAHPSF